MAATLERVVAPVEPSEPRRDVRIGARRVLAVAVLVVPAAIILWCGWQRRWTADDGFINLRVVRQVVEGHGPVFNAGQRVEVGTSPAWIAILAVFDLLTPFRLEWIAAITGLLSTVGAVVLAVFGTRRALHAVGVTGVLLIPLGALAYVSIPPAWDFATSGLETGVALLWLAVGWWFLCGRVGADGSARIAWYVPVVLGLGPVVRPDFLVFSVGFVVALVLLSSRSAVWRIVLFAAAVPVVTELARMAYFASLVPNTAMAKEASLSNWSQGMNYLVDFVGSYVVVVPLALLAGLVWAEMRTRPGGRASTARRYTVLSVVVACAAIVHALYVVKVGGDFMHARLLLPAYFAVLLPASVVAARGAARVVAAAVVMWSIAAIFVLRPPYSNAAPRPGTRAAFAALEPSTGIGDERRFYVLDSSESHPVTIDDYLRHDRWAQSAASVRRLAAREQSPVLVLHALSDAPIVVPLRPGSAPRTVTSAENLGFYGYAVGIGVDVIDEHGLADVLAGHLRLQVRGRPGHEKSLPEVWTFARFAAPGAPRPPGVTAAQVGAARRALSCGAMHGLLERTDGPWTITDTPANVLESLRSFTFRFDQDPIVAAREECGS